MKDITLTVEMQRELKKELLTTKWDSPKDAEKIRAILEKHLGLYSHREV